MQKKKLVALHKFFNWLWQQNPLISFTVLLGMRATVNPTKKKPKGQKQSEKSLKNAFNFAAAEMWQPKIKVKDQKSRLCSCLVMMISSAVFSSSQLANPSVHPANPSIQSIHNNAKIGNKS